MLSQDGYRILVAIRESSDEIRNMHPELKGKELFVSAIPLISEKCKLEDYRVKSFIGNSFAAPCKYIDYDTEAFLTTYAKAAIVEFEIDEKKRKRTEGRKTCYNIVSLTAIILTLIITIIANYGSIREWLNQVIQSCF